MSWSPSSRFAPPLVAAALLVTASAAAADILVVRSLGPSAKSYPPGKRLPETARLSLKASDQVVVLDGRGTRIIRGPGTFTAGVPVAGTRTASAATGDRRSKITASRGNEEQGRPPSIWYLDVTRSSTVCVADAAKVTLWRPLSPRPLTLTLSRAGATVKQVSWPAETATLVWPSEVPVSDGAEYQLSWAGLKTPTTLRLRTVPQKPAGLEDMAQTLIRSGCEAQLDLFIDTVKLPD